MASQFADGARILGTTALYKCVTEALFALSDDAPVYPARDYPHRRVSSIGQEMHGRPDTKLVAGAKRSSAASCPHGGED